MIIEWSTEAVGRQRIDWLRASAYGKVSGADQAKYKMPHPHLNLKLLHSQSDQISHWTFRNRLFPQFRIHFIELTWFFFLHNFVHFDDFLPLQTFQWAGPAIFKACGYDSAGGCEEAVATIAGSSQFGLTGISGLAVFRKATGGTQVSIEIKGLKSKEADAFHVHETAVKNGDCSTTGEHFNPGGIKEVCKGPVADQTKCQVGDLSGKGGRLNARGGGQEAGRNYLDKVIKISDIVGRSVVIHSASGARIGCGNISCRRK
ncbi:hypothetical protein Pst134EA_007762 [Puccinia striiformis f. sp. tritici]|uniref:hypothetical protein n=1 Tax=Puccinia striiformis f. sp. tritici TaxID=168172 RepID=UPI002008C932|nr:hypothetical protein Pst134EA_007762 [Puccinia striiformis f. sp. tritici]KAH9460665.1 hypothetical protein Pst134EB_008829 [Puccinia striiformis f. sp. tritici]KAH9470510.1 hypothetical protein Pst134EA_007762 [Puccinia striiformis f. sp. tritici]KAI9610921.1 hypothetical protein H4Q26_008767 [Puccinia striiformis f. sp. tritici PST-130]